MKAKVDKEARWVSELETDDFRVAAWIKGEDSPAGLVRTRQAWRCARLMIERGITDHAKREI